MKFTEFDVSVNRAAAAEIVSKTGQSGVPVIQVNGETVIGFDRSRLERLLAGTGRRRAGLGLKVADARRSAAGQVSGALVGSVAPASVGERAGIRKGDVITGMDGKLIRDAGELERALADAAPGNQITLRVLRDRKELSTSVEI